MPKAGKNWKGPNIAQIAALAGVGPASVDRVLNNRPGVKETTRNRVMAALDKLAADHRMQDLRQIGFFCISGPSFNGQMIQAMQMVNASIAGVELTGQFFTTEEIEPGRFAAALEQAGRELDAVIVIAYEHPAINGALRKIAALGKPTVCLTSDLPSSRRTVYVGNDQYAAGSVAAQLIGQILPPVPQHILLVMSVPFRCQQEREMGFRRVLRQDYPHLSIQERVISNDNVERTEELLASHLASARPPGAIYNVAGANRGVGAALEHAGLSGKTVFIGHELTPFTRVLLEAGTMDYVISHDSAAELVQAVRAIDERLRGIESQPAPSSILIHTRYNCN
ncbi:LacI family DNA-binding transcriptional regulator (plasmid) [Thioclava sp. 'Guangxiensis']|uniref:LacI family DNA-binding transcriptional regulator n=1 Tax=Thioclava sp. 'Guangxiensis' TaxID=3149044 RepID=UPI0032C43397